MASKAKPKRPTKAEQRAEMMEQILDTAENLFSKHGFYGVTLKDVAKLRVSQRAKSEWAFRLSLISGGLSLSL